jgi:hypothetical protein
MLVVTSAFNFGMRRPMHHKNKMLCQGRIRRNNNDPGNERFLPSQELQTMGKWANEKKGVRRIILLFIEQHELRSLQGGG